MNASVSRPRRRLAVAGGGLIVLVATAAIAWFALVRSGGPSAGGPVDVFGKVGLSHPIWVGRPTFSGLVQLENKGDEPVVLESVRPLDKPAALTILHTYAVGPDREYEFAPGWKTWPTDEYAKSKLEPISGFVMPPSSKKAAWPTTNIVFVFRAEKAGTFEWKLVEVKYRIGDRHYRRVIGTVMQVCTRPDSMEELPACEGEPTLPSSKAVADA